jgi:hypothetical protein
MLHGCGAGRVAPAPVHGSGPTQVDRESARVNSTHVLSHANTIQLFLRLPLVASQIEAPTAFDIAPHRHGPVVQRWNVLPLDVPEQKSTPAANRGLLLPVDVDLTDEESRQNASRPSRANHQLFQSQKAILQRRHQGLEQQGQTDFKLSPLSNSLFITHWENYRSQTLPTDSTDEPSCESRKGSFMIPCERKGSFMIRNRTTQPAIDRGPSQILKFTGHDDGANA